MAGPTARWSSSNESVGRVGTDGLFTAVGPGSVEITALVGTVSGRETITVGGPSVQSVQVDRTSLQLTAGERTTLQATARDRDLANVALAASWRSNNPDVATVNERGEVVAMGPGQATLTVSAGSASTTVSVTVAAALVEARAAIPDLIAAYARALVSRDIVQVRQAYFGMTQQQETQLRASLTNLQSATLNVESIDDQGDVATAMVRGQYVFTFDGRSQQTPVSFRATFERADTGWRMTRTEDAR
jgi:hypothetical protein